GFIAVYPEATRPEMNKPADFLQNPPVWNDGSTGSFADIRKIDDVGFIRSVMDDVQSRYAVDPKRVFVAGFSRGGSMAFRLGAQISDRIAAMAQVAGRASIDSIVLSRPVSMIYITGTADPLNPYDGGKVMYPWGWSEQKPPVIDSINKWLAAASCGNAPQALSQAEDGVQLEI